MKVSVSNLAWNNENNLEVFMLLQKFNIRNIEGVLTKICDWDKLNESVLQSHYNLLKTYNIQITSLQSLFFNFDCDNLFEPKVIKHIEKIIELSKQHPINILVLGSPKLRKKVHGWEIKLVDFFTQIDNLLKNTKISMVIEPNSSIYGGEFFYKLSEIVDFLEKNNFTKIKTMVDTHNSILENQNPIVEYDNYSKFIEHIHISEKKLLPLEDIKFHTEFSNFLRKKEYKNIITYELLECDNLYDTIKTFNELYSI